MGFIKQLHLENFQSHKDTKLSFDSGLTVILGQTDQGKSAIIRALKWALYNEPRGSEFVTVGCKVCRVTLEMQDGTIITRERDGQKNRYILIQDGETQIFEGFGNNVPLEIIKAHGIPKIYIDRDSTSAVNLAEQLEGPFLISESGSNRAKALGRLVGVHIIDAAQRTTNKDLVDKQQRQKQLTIDIEKIKKELEVYEDIDLISDKLLKLRGYLADLKGKKEQLEKLQNIRNALKPVEREIESSATVIAKTNFLKEIERYVMTCDTLSARYHILSRIRVRLSDVAESISSEEGNIKKTEGIEQAKKDQQTISTTYGKLVKIRQIKHDISGNSELLEATKTVLEKTKEIPEVTDIYEDTSKHIDTLQKYKIRLRQWEMLNSEIKTQLIQLRKYEHAKQWEENIKIIAEKKQTLKSLDDLKTSLLSIEASITKGEHYLEGLSDNIRAMAGEYSVLLKKFSRCPTCLSPIDDEKTSRIVGDMISE